MSAPSLPDRRGIRAARLRIAAAAAVALALVAVGGAPALANDAADPSAPAVAPAAAPAAPAAPEAPVEAPAAPEPPAPAPAPAPAPEPAPAPVTQPQPAPAPPAAPAPVAEQPAVALAPAEQPAGERAAAEGLAENEASDPADEKADESDPAADEQQPKSDIENAEKPQADEANQAPIAVNDSYEMHEGTTLSVSAPGVLGNDSDPDGSFLQINDHTKPAIGTLNTLAIGGAFSYTAPAGYTGPVTFTYLVRDAAGATATGTVTVSVKPKSEPVVQPPVTTSDSYLYAFGSPLYIAAPGVLANDGLHGDAATVSLEYKPSNVDVTVNPDGSFLFQSPVYEAYRWFQYRVCTVGGCSIGMVELNPAKPGEDPSGPSGPPSETDHAPVAVNDSYTVAAGQTLTVAAPGLLANDTDEDGDTLAVILSSAASHAIVQNVQPTGALTYTPQPGFTGVDTFSYHMTDGTDTRIAQVTITVTSAGETNRPPVAVDDHYTIEAGQTLNVLAPGVLLNDTDPDGDPLTVKHSGSPEHYAFKGSWFDGRIQYKPANGYTGPDSFTYTVSDGKGGEATATVHITVIPPEVPNHAVDDAYQATSGKTLEIAAPGLLGNDVCGAPWTPTVNGAGDPLHGTLNWNTDGSFSYTPDAGYVGVDGFGYQMLCGTALYTGEVVITVGAAQPEEPGEPEEPTGPEQPSTPAPNTPAPNTPRTQPNGGLALTGANGPADALLAVGMTILLGLAAVLSAARRRTRG